MSPTFVEILDYDFLATAKKRRINAVKSLQDDQSSPINVVIHFW